MSQTVSVEISDQEIIDCIRSDSDLLLQCVAELAERAKPATAERTMYVEELRILGGQLADLEMDPVTWAQSFATFDSIDQQRALAELRRCMPITLAGTAL